MNPRLWVIVDYDNQEVLGIAPSLAIAKAAVHKRRNVPTHDWHVEDYDGQIMWETSSCEIVIQEAPVI